MKHHITSLDLAVIAGYFFVIVVIGWLVARKTKTGSDLFLAGRSLGFFAVGFSLFASNISSTTLVGLTGQAYETGISVANYEWMAGIIFLVMAVFTIPVFFKSEVTTVPQYLALRYNGAARRYFSGFTVLVSMAVDTAGGLYAGALVLRAFYPGLDLWLTCIVLALIAGVYTAAGGLKAVVYTDILQAIILIIGSSALAFSVLSELDFRFDTIVAQLPEGHLSLIRPLDDPALPWLGTLIGIPVIGFYFWSTNQYIVQRVLGARSITHARWGATLAGALKLTPLFIMVLPGALAPLLYPGLDKPDSVFPTLVTKQLPVGITGLVLAGLIAAIMSSIDSTLNSASTLIVHDFIETDRRRLSEQKRAWLGRGVTLGLMVMAAVWAPMIQNFPGLFAYLQEMMAYAVPPVVVVYLMGMLWKKGTTAAALSTLGIGHLTGLVVLAVKQSGGLTQVHFTILAGILFAYCLVIFISISLFTQPHEEERREQALWNKDMARAGDNLMWFQDYRVQGAVLLAMMAGLLTWLW